MNPSIAFVQQSPVGGRFFGIAAIDRFPPIGTKWASGPHYPMLRLAHFFTKGGKQTFAALRAKVCCAGQICRQPHQIAIQLLLDYASSPKRSIMPKLRRHPRGGSRFSRHSSFVRS